MRPHRWSLSRPFRPVKLGSRGVGTLAACLVGLGSLVQGGCSADPCVDDGFFQSSNEDCAKLLRSACLDGKRNGDESDIDCGGSCGPCAEGRRCEHNSDCESENCEGNLCVPGKNPVNAACDDGRRNGDETDIDCGGSCPARCEERKKCAEDRDCESGACDPNSRQCIQASCRDSKKNNRESDVDCGGPSCSGCASGEDCLLPFDCLSLACAQNKCGEASCKDGLPNGQESDVDCGGPKCPACENKSACEEDSDCESKACVQGVCVDPSCKDQQLSPSESDVDCGGPCPGCARGKNCKEASDCASKKCVNDRCMAASCSDGILNGGESDVDCGASCPKGCELEKDCRHNQDCQSGHCVRSECVAASCVNKSKDGSETDVDCGGECGASCETGQSCADHGDCRSGSCGTDKQCQAPRCDDGTLNGFETSLDCGGLLCPPCDLGKECLADRDCKAGKCLNSKCQQTGSCGNKVKDANESDVDCGGACGATCSIGQNCANKSDCASDRCTDGVCEGLVYEDKDSDGFGDELSGKMSKSIPVGWTTQGGDCNDSDARTFPGAAKTDSPTDCMKDSDGDGRGDIDPPEGVSKGSDCYEDDAGFWECLKVEMPPGCLEVSAGSGELSVTASLGKGNYSYSWTPSEFLNGADTASPTISGLTGPRKYTVVVSDGARSETGSVMVVPSEKAKFQGGDCVTYTNSLEVGYPIPTITYPSNGEHACATDNGELAIHICGDNHYENVELRGELRVDGPDAANDDDMMGVVWGAQDSANFYILSWKRQTQAVSGMTCSGAVNQVPAGIVVKRVHDSTQAGAPKGFAQLDGADLFCENSTDRSTLLLGPLKTMNKSIDEGWVFNRSYSVSIKYTPTGSSVRITYPGANPGDPAQELTTFEVVDPSADRYTKGGFGGLTYSQEGACVQDLTVGCMP